MKGTVLLPEIKAKVQQKIEKNHFITFIGFTFTHINQNYTEGYLNILPHHTQQNGFAHGGIMTTLCDTVAGFAAYTAISLADQVVTAEIKVSYYYPGVGNRLYAAGWVIKQGKKLLFCESEVYTINEVDETKKVCAKATTTMAIL